MTTLSILSIGCIGGGLIALLPDTVTNLWQRFQPERYHRVCITDQSGNVVRSLYISNKDAGELITFIDSKRPVRPQNPRNSFTFS
jgi:hypothetical protein